MPPLTESGAPLAIALVTGTAAGALYLAPLWPWRGAIAAGLAVAVFGVPALATALAAAAAVPAWSLQLAVALALATLALEGSRGVTVLAFALAAAAGAPDVWAAALGYSREAAAAALFAIVIGPLLLRHHG